MHALDPTQSAMTLEMTENMFTSSSARREPGALSDVNMLSAISNHPDSQLITGIQVYHPVVSHLDPNLGKLIPNGTNMGILKLIFFFSFFIGDGLDLTRRDFTSCRNERTVN